MLLFKRFEEHCVRFIFGEFPDQGAFPDTAPAVYDDEFAFCRSVCIFKHAQFGVSANEHGCFPRKRWMKKVYNPQTGEVNCCLRIIKNEKPQSANSMGLTLFADNQF